MKLRAFFLAAAFSAAATTSWAQSGLRVFGAQQFMLDDNVTGHPSVFLSQNGGSLGIDNSGVVTPGTFPSACALLDVSSTTQGFLPPRMTTAQELAICGGTPTEGLMVYNATTHSLDVWNGGVFGQFWTTKGNTGTNATTDFIGTKDNVSLAVRVNNAQTLGLNTNGSIQRDASGNPRGVNAVDLQIQRSVATQVASGVNAVLLGGLVNTASGVQSVVAGGQLNQATNNNASIVGGAYNTASGIGSFIGGGGYDGSVISGNTASGGASVVGGGITNMASGVQSFVGGGQNDRATTNNATVVGGVNNTASGMGSFVGGGGYDGASVLGNTASGKAASVVGGLANSASGDYSRIGGGAGNSATGPYSSVGGGLSAVATKFGQTAQASGRFANSGDAQSSVYVMRNQTSDATPTSLFLDGAAARLTIQNNAAYSVRVQVVAINLTTPTQSGAFSFDGVLLNNGGATSGNFAATSTQTTGAFGGTVSVNADAVNNALNVQVTGVAGQNIRWVARVKTAEVSF